MSLSLNKWPNTAQDRNFRNDTNENWSKIENTVNSIEKTSNQASASATEAEKQAVDANNLSNSIKKQLDTLVVNGDSSVEAAQARVDASGTVFSTLKDRLNASDALMEDINLNKTYSRPIYPPTSSIVTFMTDDGQIADYNVVKPMADLYGIPLTIAVIPTSVGANPNFMNLTQIKQLQSEGWEIVSHTYNHVELDKLTRSQIEYQMKAANQYFVQNGLNVKNICYPVGKYNDDVMDIARKYYRAGLASHLAVNEMPINTYNLNRYLIDEYDITVLKSIVDRMLTRKQWVIFYSHPQGWTDIAGQKTKMNELMSYVKSKGIPTKTVNDALNMYENKLEIGNSTTKYFRVGADGSVETKPNFNYVFAGKLSGIKNDTPITSFEKFKVTTATFNVSEASGIPLNNGIGTLTTYRLHDDDALSFQVFEALNLKTAKRSWNGSSNVWNDWITDSIPASSIKNDTPITSFPKGVVSYAVFRSQDGGNIPFNNSVGVLKTHRVLGEDGLSYQEWNGVASNIVYRRVWLGAYWGVWESLYTFKNNFVSASLGNVNANSMSSVDVTIPGLKTTGAINVTFLSTVPDNILYTCTVPSADTLRIKLYNISNVLIPLGGRTIQVVQF